MIDPTERPPTELTNPERESLRDELDAYDARERFLDRWTGPGAQILVVLAVSYMLGALVSALS